MADYGLEVWKPMGPVIAAISGHTGLSYDGSVDEGETISFSLDGNTPGAEHIREMITDIVLYRENQKIFRGRVVSATDEVDAISHTITVNCVDYKSLLKRRHVYSTTPNGTSLDLEELAWKLIDYSQTRGTDWSLGITRGSSQAVGVTSSSTWDYLSNIKENIDSLAKSNTAEQATNYFEWTIDPELRFKAHRPTRGRQSPQFDASLGGTVLSFGTTFDPNSYSNYFFVSGSSGAWTAKYSLDIGKYPGGVFEEVVNDSALTSVDATDAAAFWLITFHGQLELLKSYALEIASERWGGPTELWVGDYVNLNLNSGRLKVNSSQFRVLNLHLEVDEAGQEHLAVEVGYAPAFTYRDFSRMSAQMRAHRMQVLNNRARWYDQQYHKMLNEAMRLKPRRGGKASAAYKAAYARFRALADKRNTFYHQDKWPAVRQSKPFS